MTLSKKIFEKFQLSSGLKKYFANTSWLLFEKIFRMFVQLFIGIYVVRYLGPKQFGILTYAYSFVSIFSAFATLGLENIVIRNMVKDKEIVYKILGISFYLRLSGAIFSFAVIYIALMFTNNDSYTTIIVMIVACWLIFDSFSVIDYYFRSQVQAKLSSVAQIVMFMTSTAIKVIFILIEAPLIYFAWLYVFESFILAMTLIIFYLKLRLPLPRFSINIRDAIDLLKDSWPLMFTNIIVMIYMRIDQVMIKEMLDAESVGIYGASVKLSEVWYFIPMALHNSLLPAVINAKQISEDLYYKRIQALFDLSVWAALIIAIPTIIFADLLIPILLGDAFLQAVSVLKIQIWTSLFVFLGVSIGQWFVVENLQKIYFYRVLSGAIINVLLNLCLIPVIGIKGAAISTVISQFFVCYVSLLFFKNTRHVFWFATKSLNVCSSFKRIVVFIKSKEFSE